MIKNMNSKMTKNSQLSTTEPKNKQKQTKQTTRTRTGSQKRRSQRGLSVGGRGIMQKKLQGLRSIIGRQKIDKIGYVKNSMGNGEAKELICTTHGHELRGEMLEVMGIPGRRGKGEKLDNCNIIINKIYLTIFLKEVCHVALYIMFY